MNLRRTVVLGYVALVVAAVGYAGWDSTVDHPDASFAALPAIVLTLPTSLLLLAALDRAGLSGPVGGAAVLLAAGGGQAYGMWLLLRAQPGRRSRA